MPTYKNNHGGGLGLMHTMPTNTCMIQSRIVPGGAIFVAHPDEIPASYLEGEKPLVTKMNDEPAIEAPRLDASYPPPCS